MNVTNTHASLTLALMSEMALLVRWGVWRLRVSIGLSVVDSVIVADRVAGARGEGHSPNCPQMALVPLATQRARRMVLALAIASAVRPSARAAVLRGARRASGAPISTLRAIWRVCCLVMVSFVVDSVIVARGCPPEGGQWTVSRVSLLRSEAAL